MLKNQKNKAYKFYDSAVLHLPFGVPLSLSDSFSASQS
uniref:Uncharacterized protein n=1 Tax=Anguilla anguilla TaxID=7936 RepID=A0A0E9UML6_ANGAN